MTAMVPAESRFGAVPIEVLDRNPCQTPLMARLNLAFQLSATASADQASPTQ
jgi:hypothetical protein